MEKIRIFIADDDADWREKLCDYLDGNHNFEVIGTAEDGEEACSKLKEFEPDILILDICMLFMTLLLSSINFLLQHRMTVCIFVQSFLC